MKRRIRFLALTVSLLIMLGAFSSFFVSAEDDPTYRTDTYYMNGYKMYGRVMMNCDLYPSAPEAATCYTVCDNIDYGKACYFDYCYKYFGIEKHITLGDPNYFVYPEGSNNFYIYHTYTSQTDNPVYIQGQHKVRASQYMIWSSHESEDDSYIGRIPDYSDV